MQAPQLLLALPTDILRIIVSFVVLSPTSHITVRFVCRRFRNLVPPSQQQARQFCELAATDGYLNLIKWARANGCPWDERHLCLVLLKVVISRCCSGHAPMDAPGMSAPVPMLLKVVISRC